MIRLLRTDSTHPDFLQMVALLDRDLAIRDGDEHAFYAQYNKVDKINHCIVAYADEKPIGCGAIRAYGQESMEIKRMFVLPEWRGKNVAGGILTELEKWAAELGFAHCILETGLMQPEAIRLYQKSGYTTIPNYGPYADVENSVCMEKWLKNKAL